jgi:N-dimethylarginine dimethylaminohydrolase
MPPEVNQAQFWHQPVQDLPRIKPLLGVLLGDPAFFQIERATNAHMTSADGALHRIDPFKARKEWLALKNAYESIGIATAILPAQPGLPDACFTANPSMVLPFPDGTHEVWLAKMAHPSRADEVHLHRKFFENQPCRIRTMPESVSKFEGCGDGLLHPNRFLLHAGFGARSSRAAWEHLAKTHPTLTLCYYSLPNPDFYHLDTALAPINETTALYAPEAFTADGMKLLQKAFPHAIALPHEESLRFAGNAHCPDQKHVLLQSGCPQTERLLHEHGFQPIPLETSQFRLSGGSVFCLKQSCWTSACSAPTEAIH